MKHLKQSKVCPPTVQTKCAAQERLCGRGHLLHLSLRRLRLHQDRWLLWRGDLPVASLFLDGPQDRNQVPLISFLKQFQECIYGCDRQVERSDTPRCPRSDTPRCLFRQGYDVSSAKATMGLPQIFLSFLPLNTNAKVFSDTFCTNISMCSIFVQTFPPGVLHFPVGQSNSNSKTTCL